MGSSPTRGSSFFLGKVTALGVLCCFYLVCLFICLTLLAPCFLLPSFSSLIKTCTSVHVHVHVHTYYMFLMRDEKEERRKQARSNKQTRQSNTAHPIHVHVCYKVSHIGGCGVQVSVLPLSGYRCSSAVSSQVAAVLHRVLQPIRKTVSSEGLIVTQTQPPHSCVLSTSSHGCFSEAAYCGNALENAVHHITQMRLVVGRLGGHKNRPARLC